MGHSTEKVSEAARQVGGAVLHAPLRSLHLFGDAGDLLVGQRFQAVVFSLLLGDFPGKEGLADRCYSHENDYLRLHPGVIYPGVGEALRTLSAHLPLAVVSNCQAGYIEVFLEASGFGAYFAGHLGFGDTGLPKWENIRLMCERLGLRHPIYVGDTQGDADAAARVGIPFAHARYGFGTVRRADRVIASPAELPSLCAAAAGGTPETPLPGGRKGGIWQKSTL